MLLDMVWRVHNAHVNFGRDWAIYRWHLLVTQAPFLLLATLAAWAASCAIYWTSQKSWNVKKTYFRRLWTLKNKLEIKKSSRKGSIFFGVFFLSTCDFKTHKLSKQSHERLSWVSSKTASSETALITSGFWSHTSKEKHTADGAALARWPFYFEFVF